MKFLGQFKMQIAKWKIGNQQFEGADREQRTGGRKKKSGVRSRESGDKKNRRNPKSKISSQFHAQSPGLNREFLMFNF
jgi:hypothetical protein